jgi:hypothetical protein
LSILWTSEKTVVVPITLLVLDRPPGSRLVPEELFDDVTIHQSLTVTEGCVGIKDVFQLVHSNWNRSSYWQTSHDSQAVESDISSAMLPT